MITAKGLPIQFQNNSSLALLRYSYRDFKKDILFDGSGRQNIAQQQSSLQADRLEIAHTHERENLIQPVYRGNIPSSLGHAFGLEAEQLLPELDRIADILQKPATTTNKTIKIRSNQHDIDFIKVGQGSFAKVYKISDGQRKYVLKVHYPDLSPKSGPHSISQEIDNAEHLTRLGVTKDVCRFYGANPEAGWILYEYISRFARIKNREGITLKEASLRLDDNSWDNRRGGVRIDLGGTLAEIPPKKSKSRCLVPESDGVKCIDLATKEGIWDRFYTEAPRLLTQSERLCRK
jgi:hypothetical protein